MGLQGWLVPWPCPSGCFQRSLLTVPAPCLDLGGQCSLLQVPGQLRLQAPRPGIRRRHASQVAGGPFPPHAPAYRPLGHWVTADPPPLCMHAALKSAERPPARVPAGPSATQITRSRTRG